MSEECPVCQYMSKSLAEVNNKYQGKVDFKLVFPQSLSDYKTMALWKKKYGLEAYKSVLDEDQSLSKKLGAKITPEAIIENSKGEIVYRGRINDGFFKVGKMRSAISSHDLDNAIAALLHKKTITTPWPKAVGCYITYLKK